MKKVWSSEMGAMSYVKIPAVLDIMLLTAVVDNRKLILKLRAPATVNQNRSNS